MNFSTLQTYLLTVFHIESVLFSQSHDHSKCIRPNLPAYDVKPQNITIQLGGLFVSGTVMLFKKDFAVNTGKKNSSKFHL